VYEKGERMTLEHRDWQANRHRTLHHFWVEGRITNPAERLTDGAYMVTTRASLLKLDHQPLLPDILLLRLSLTQERQFPYTPPAQQPAHPVRYYQEPIGADEETCTKVCIRYNGETLADIAVRDS
jgi:hypothetical protein